MIPAAMDFLPRRRAVHPLAAGWTVTPEQHGSTGQQVYGRMPEWPADWAAEGRYRLDEYVFGDVPAVRS